MNKLMFLITLVFPLLMNTSCKKEDSPSVTYPTTYVYDGIETDFLYYTYEKQNGTWVRIPNTNDLIPDFSTFTGSFQSVTLTSDNSLTVTDDGELYEADYEFSNNTISARVDGQGMEFETDDFSSLTVKWISQGEWDEFDGGFVSAFCGDEDCSSAEGADNFFIIPGWFDDDDILFVVVLEQRFVQQ